MKKINLSDDDIYQKKQALIKVAKRCFELGLQTNSGGNLSVKLTDSDAIIIKPSGIGFNECTQENLMIVDFDHRILFGEEKPSKDLDFHLALYRLRKDIESVVHVHSPWATGWASAGLELPSLTVQSIEKLGQIPLIPLSKDGGPQTGEDVIKFMFDPNVKAALLSNHGTIGVGKNLIQACYIVELIEETAKIAFVRNGLLNFSNHSNVIMPKIGAKKTS